MFHLTADDFWQLLPLEDAVEALRAFHEAPANPVVGRHLLQQPDGPGTFASLSAWSDTYIAVKLIGAFPGNPSLPAPLAAGQGLVALLDGKTGVPLMTCDAAALTHCKTAADSALGVDLLARRDSETLLIVGAGGLAEHFIRAISAMRPNLRRIWIWNRTEERAGALVERLRGHAIPCMVAADLGSALAEADIVSSLTMSEVPLVRGQLLQPGAHVDLVGSYQPQMREADDAVLTRAGRLFLDTRLNCEASGDVCQPLADGILRREQIEADLFDLCSGKHGGRASDADITVYKNVGGGHLDLAVAAEVYRRAMRG